MSADLSPSPCATITVEVCFFTAGITRAAGPDMMIEMCQFNRRVYSRLCKSDIQGDDCLHIHQFAAVLDARRHSQTRDSLRRKSSACLSITIRIMSLDRLVKFDWIRPSLHIS